jgi:hypothetical protein
MQSLTNSLVAKDDKFHSLVQRLFRKLYKACGLFPPSLLLKGVKMEGNRHPVATGGFAEIYKGNYNETEVAIKRLNLRIGEESKVNKVR